MKTPSELALLTMALTVAGAASNASDTFEPAQVPVAAVHAGQLAHQLDRLAHTGRVLYVAAHPDDENTRLLAYLANEAHLAAGYLSMTRGGGGQNLVGDEQGELLDVIRTEELLAARTLDGALQRFTRMRDFGYSKTAEETLAAWDHQQALSDVVRVIRTFQPDVVLTRFDEKPPNHGHHTASAILAREAFTAAADPALFPEQLRQGLKPWQAKRLVHNISTWREAPVPPDAIELDVGAYDPRLGMSYGELAALSRSRHASQGFGVAGERGPIVERFAPVAGAGAATKHILEGIDLTWTRFGAAGAKVDAALREAQAALHRDHPERALPALRDAHRAFDALPDEPRVRDGRRALDGLIAGCAGLFVRATAPRWTAVPGSEVKVDVELVLRREAPLTCKRLTFPGVAPVEDGAPLVRHAKKVISQSVTIPKDAPVSAPYWLAAAPAAGRQVVADASLIGEPASPPALSVRIELGLEDRTVRLEAPVVHAWVDPVRGERTRAFAIMPPATVTPSREAVLFPGGRSAPVELRVRAAADAIEGDVTLELPTGWKASPASQPVSLKAAGDDATVRFEVTPPAGAGPVDVVPVLTVAGRAWSWRESLIDHAHVPLQVVLQPASLRLSPVALKLPAGRVGYVEGSGDTVAEDLAHAGMTVESIDGETLRGGDLSRFAAIVVGIRAFNVRADVRASHGRLMAFVEQGGTLVVQYNTNNRVAPLMTPLGPFPFEVGRDRITDETAAMTPVRADHPALHAPNELQASDFEGWKQERGIYFASSWDERYEPLFSSVDPGEKPLLGGTLVARHGKGRYVYTGLAFFRQLPAGVPGAYRLFANLLAPATAP